MIEARLEGPVEARRATNQRLRDRRRLRRTRRHPPDQDKEAAASAHSLAAWLPDQDQDAAASGAPSWAHHIAPHIAPLGVRGNGSQGGPQENLKQQEPPICGATTTTTMTVKHHHHHNHRPNSATTTCHHEQSGQPPISSSSSSRQSNNYNRPDLKTITTKVNDQQQQQQQRRRLYARAGPFHHHPRKGARSASNSALLCLSALALLHILLPRVLVPLPSSLVCSATASEQQQQQHAHHAHHGRHGHHGRREVENFADLLLDDDDDGDHHLDSWRGPLSAAASGAPRNSAHGGGPRGAAPPPLPPESHAAGGGGAIQPSKQERRRGHGNGASRTAAAAQAAAAGKKSAISSRRERARLARAASLRSKRHQQQREHNSSGDLNNGQQPSPFADNAADRPVVRTSKGLVRGITRRTFTNKSVDAFLGIPFGQPPLGRYRFRHPQPVRAWEGELDASRLSHSCYQVNDTFFGATFGGTSIWNANTPLDENCLHLNIWTPFAAANTVVVGGSGSGASTSGSHTQNNRNNQNQNNNPKRPVLVWIFGGGFYSGTPTLSLYEGGAMASEEDLVVVSINYRVSALGFLYFGRPEAPGNAGLFDQLLALQWIQDEIEQFGGDPERVTIFGESAGAVSVAFHLLSPLSRNLFAQGILQSGAATCPWGHMEPREIMQNGLQLASTLGCPSNASDLDAVIECLLQVHPMALVSQEVGQTQSSVLNFPFVPVVDGAFLLEPPAESLAKGNFKPARLLLGSNNDEGNAFLIYMPEFSHCPTQGAGPSLATPTSATVPPTAPEFPLNTSASGLPPPPQDELDHFRFTGDEAADAATRRQVVARSPAQLATTISNNQNNNKQQIDTTNQAANEQQQQQQKPCKPNENLQMTREDFLRLLREDLNPWAEHPLGKRAIVFEYSNWVNPLDPVSNYDALDKIVGDYYFTCHVNEFALRYAQAGNSVYMYHFKQRSSLSPWPKWMGVIHADEINFVFGEPLNAAFKYTEKEKELSRRMMKYWANFARFGNPTHQESGGQTQANPNANTTTTTAAGSDQWPEYLPERRQYFELHSEYTRVGRGPRAKQCAFWSHYLPQLLQAYDKNNQCHPRAAAGQRRRPSLTSPFGASGGGGGELDDDGARDFAPRGQRPAHAQGAIPSYISFTLIVIVALLLVAAAGAATALGSSLYLKGGQDGGPRRRLPSWLAGLWPPWPSRGAGAGGGRGGSANAGGNGGDDDDETTDGASATPRQQQRQQNSAT